MESSRMALQMSRIQKNNFSFDIVLALTVLFLLLFGMVMIISIGVPKSISLSAPDIMYPSCSDEGVDCYFLFKRHLFRLLAGLFAGFIAYKFSLKLMKKLSPFFYIVILIMLFFVLIGGESFGTIASNWIVIFNTSLQPSELAKLSITLYLAYWFSKRGEAVESLTDGFIPFAVISGLVVIPIVLQNDFGATLTIAIIATFIYTFAGAKLKHLGLGFLIAAMASALVIANVSHVQERFKGFMNVEEGCMENYCWQSQQANIAVGSGGFFGKGLTQGIQKSYWLPQASDDFIFAASAEELGFLRIIVVVIAYFIISLRGYAIASHAKNKFEAYTAVGITTWIAGQAYINIAVNTAMMPVTGITLPFVSYGGSSLLASLIGVGILLNISKNTSDNANSFYRRRNRRSHHPQLRRYRRA